MGTDLISVIMSTYNETVLELNKSINSILNQTYKNIELIIINDSPDNGTIIDELYRIQKSDPRVKIYLNPENIGLVRSLNKALSYASGYYIARMDADDISDPQRLERQFNAIKNENFDLIGGNVNLINEKDKVIGKLNFPKNGKDISFFMRWGSCLAHPTWFGEKKVFENLGGYRSILYCEDYDFLLRALAEGYKLGNCQANCLEYRVRKNSISQSYSAEQYVMRKFLYRKRKYIQQLSEKDVNDYANSMEYVKEVQLYKKFLESKEKIKGNKWNLYNITRLFFNKYTYHYFEEKIGLKLRGMR